MISLVSDPHELILDDGYYSGRIYAALSAYGTGYDFCRLYRHDKGSGLIYNSSCVLSGETADTDELESFIIINSPMIIECPPSVGNSLSLTGYERRHRILFERTAPAVSDESPEEAGLSDMYNIVKEAFGETEFDLWYADMSHRIRHGVSRAYIYKGISCACVDFVYKGYGYISQVASLSEYRRKGYAGRLLDMISRSLSGEGTITRLWAYDELEGFYLKAGFSPVGEDYIYIGK